MIYLINFNFRSFFLVYRQAINFLKQIYLFLEAREEEMEANINVWEKHQLVASCMPPTGDLAHNPGMCPDQESNQRPFS